MAKIRKISGYVVDIEENFTESMLERLIEYEDWITQHLHVETADIGEWCEDSPLNFYDCDLAECEKWFHKEPTIDPVKHGEWERIPYSFAGGYRCSCCGQKSLERDWNYCPNCGAKMDGE
jgi:hypothetical protein